MWRLLPLVALAGCASVGSVRVTPQQATTAATIAVTVNNTGAVVAGVVDPAIAIPAGLGARLADAVDCSVSALFGGGC
jgi:hypothetical protein